MGEHRTFANHYFFALFLPKITKLKQYMSVVVKGWSVSMKHRMRGKEISGLHL